MSAVEQSPGRRPAHTVIVLAGAQGAGRSTCLRALVALRVTGPGAPAESASGLERGVGEASGSERLTRIVMAVRAPWSGETLALEVVVASPAQEPELCASADAIVFVADSDRRRALDNVAARDALEAALASSGRALAETPHVMMYNKRDLPVLGPVRELREELNRHGVDEVEAAARRGRGVLTAIVVAVHALSPRRSRVPAPPLRASRPAAAVVDEKKTS